MPPKVQSMSVLVLTAVAPSFSRPSLNPALFLTDRGIRGSKMTNWIDHRMLNRIIRICANFVAPESM